MIQSTVRFSQLGNRLDSEYHSTLSFPLRKNIYTQLGELVDINNGYPFDSRLFGTGNMPLIRIRDISETGIDFQSVGRLPSKCVDRCRPFYPKKGNILLGMDGNESRATVLRSDEKIAINQRVAIIRANKTRPEFIYLMLNSIIGKKFFSQNLTTAGTVGHISNRVIGNLPILNSILNVEEDISQFVESSMKMYDLAVQKYHQAGQILNDYLQIDELDFEFKKTFSMPFSQLADRIDGEYYQPKTSFRHPMFKDGYAKLSDIGHVYMGKTPSKHAYTQSGVKILKVRDLTNKGLSWQNGERSFVREDTWESFSKARVRENDLLLLSAAHQAYYIGKEIDIVYDIPKEFYNKLLAVAELLIIRPKLNINPFVLLWYLRTPAAYRFIQQLITGETSHLYPKDLAHLPIPKTLLTFRDSLKIEALTKESIKLGKESKQLLEEAKRKVEEIIERGGE